MTDMSKNYILEPTEIIIESYDYAPTTFLAITEDVFNNITDSCIAEVSGVLHHFDYLDNEEKWFICDNDASISAGFGYDLEGGYIMLPHEGTYTVSIYTETDDPEPTPSGDLTPETREEHYLYAIANGTSLPEDMGA